MSWHKVSDSKIANSNTSCRPSAMTEDTSSNDADNVGSDEAFTYLQGLNSDNLMQFSQQSALQELMLKEHLDVKPNVNTLPTFEEHDAGGYNFQLNVRSQGREKKLPWTYSELLHKVYIRMNDIFSIDVVYTPKMPFQQLRIRAFLCFVKDVTEPVLRCQNHISKDTESNGKCKESLLRCENPATEYCGSAEGKSINDRYSVLIPLSLAAVQKNDKSIKQTIAFKFTCQNSCIGRKETSIMILLEGMSGEILSQRMIDVKICSCPKRDKDIDERNVIDNKRKSDEDLCPRESKVRKKNVLVAKNSVDTQEKYSNGNSKSTENVDSFVDGREFTIRPTSSGNCKISMTLCKEDALRMTQYAIDYMAGIAFREPHRANVYLKYLSQLEEVHDVALNM